MLVLEQAGIGITGIWLEVQNGQCVTEVARIGAGFGGLPSAAWMLRRGRYARQKGCPPPCLFPWHNKAFKWHRNTGTAFRWHNKAF